MPTPERPGEKFPATLHYPWRQAVLGALVVFTLVIVGLFMNQRSDLPFCRELPSWNSHAECK